MTRPLTLNEELLYRQLHGNRGVGAINKLYGAERWVKDLDIIGELRGHEGCVNALQWSRDGSLLASGSDDTRVNIYNANAGFSLNTQIATGHRQNIFSVKFMPHSSDRTIITASGDTQIRLFDIEYAPTTYTKLAETAGPIVPLGSTGRFRRTYDPRPTLPSPTPGKIHDKPMRIYTSHMDRVKRIVTESSPHLFMTCSEDGTVRQFDLRQPSQFYTRPHVDPSRPAPFASFHSMNDENEDEMNPPLLSYRRHGIDLNTLSCSTSQPHYLAVGGSHEYCFLHDRRMLGRDRMAEAGKMYSRVPITEPDEESLAGATKCVRRFALGKRNHVNYHSHVTSCKISDANPNELLCSWSGDGVYLFDIRRSPLPNEEGLGREPFEPERLSSSGRAKREHDGSAQPRKRRRSSSPSESPEESVPGQSTRKICALVAELRKEIFDFASSNLLADAGDLAVERQKSYDAALALSHALLMRIEDSMEIMDEADDEFLQLLSPSSLQTERNRRSTLARSRMATRSFVIGAGCLARANGGFVEGIELGFGASSNPLGFHAPFRYQFLNAVLAFLTGGANGVQDQATDFFQHKEELSDHEENEQQSPPSEREKLDRYLEDLELGAHMSAVYDVTTNEELFASEVAMVKAFKEALVYSADSAMPEAAAKKFWGERVARAILMKEAQRIDFDFVAKAFGEENRNRRQRHVRDSGETSALLGEASEDGGNIDMDVLLDNPDEDEDEHSGDRDDDEDDEDEEDDSDGDYWIPGLEHTIRGPVEGHAPVWEHTKVYRGHCNIKTIKDVNFYGLNDEYVVSGSDCGSLFIWDKNTTQLVQLLRGDDETTNVAVGHPYEPLLAVSGIDYTVKLFSPDSKLQQEFGEKTQKAQRAKNQGVDWTYSGPASRRLMGSSKSILDRNRVNNETGRSNTILSRDMFEQFVRTLTSDGTESDEDGGTAIVEGDCTIM